DFSLSSYSQTRDGLEIHLQIVWKGKEQDLEVKVPLFGPHQATNILLATVAALKLGIAPAIIKAALKTMPQISHRLEVTAHKGGLTVIDDAYNSNPTGFASALELLETLKKPAGRAILLTPGMVELGSEHNRQHQMLGKMAAKITDLALVVGPRRMAPFIDAFHEVQGEKGVLHTFETQSAAEKWLFENTGPEDVVLIENNLPDIYEAEVGF
ncbi:MAG: glutamate ligase domain-containing protein, partial [Alphaproteobacteria bacterium]